MKSFTLPTLLALALFSLVAVVPFHPADDKARIDYLLQLRMSSTASGEIRLYFDDGKGLREALAEHAPVKAGTDVVDYRIRVPAGTFRGIRIDPINAPATLMLDSLRLTDAAGGLIRAIAPAELKPAYEIDRFSVDGDTAHVVTTPGGIDPQLRLDFDPPLTLKARSVSGIATTLIRASILFAASFGVLAAWGRYPALPSRAAGVWTWAVGHPRGAIAVVALLAVGASCHPVIFLGRSFASPNFSDGTVLLYGRFPTLPGYTDTTMAQANGSDVGALAWFNQPTSTIQHRAIFRDGELPLWQRYDCAGETLLGQGQSMFGDILHFIPIAAGGAAWAWDAKLLLARWLFSLGLGLVVLRLTRHLPAALITAASSVFIGFFLYRVNHPANYSLCYAPWMLWAWVGIAQSRDPRRALPWVAALVVVNFQELVSGTAKEAYMLLLSLNLTGAVLLLASRDPWRIRAAKLLGAAAGGVVFLALTSPVWVTFSRALASSHTSYNTPSVFQILPTLLAGVFDELFYRPFHLQNWTWNPSANIVVLAGVLYRLVTLRRVPFSREQVVVGGGAALALALAFGIVPPEWIKAVPFLGNVAHIDNTFSCVLIVHLIVLAGFGFSIAADRLGRQEGRGDLVLVALLMAGLLLPVLAMAQVVHREPFGPDTFYEALDQGKRVRFLPVVWAGFVVLPLAATGLLVAVRRRLRLGRWTPAALALAAACSVAALWRHGLATGDAFQPFVFAPGPRVDLHAPSPAIEHIRGTNQEPWRIVGFEGNLFPGWSGTYDLENISGPNAVKNPLFRQLQDALGLQRVWDWRVIVDAESLERLHRAYDMLNVRHYVDLQSRDPRIERVLTRTFSGDLDVYESATAWPRAFFTDRLARVDGAAGVARLVTESDGRPFAAMQLGEPVEVAAIPESLDGRTVTPATNYRLTSNTTTFTVEANGPGMIVIHEAWLRGDFRVAVNGGRARYVRVNHAFKGVAVDRAGTYEVQFRYWPRGFTWTLLASGAALVVLVAAAILGWRLRSGGEPTRITSG